MIQATNIPIDAQCSNGQDTKTEFPVQAFPWTIGYLLEEAGKSLGYYPDHLGSAILFATSVAIGNTIRIKVKNQWTENTTLFVALVGAPGTTKSHALSMALKPLELAEKELMKEYLKQKTDYDNAENKGQKPILKQYLISDATVEGICFSHTHNLRGLGLVRDELAGWINDFNKYRAGSDEQFWLSNWSGKPIKVNRKTQDVISIFNPKIDVCGTIQPGILNDLAKNNRSKNGFIDRILFAYPCKFEVSQWNENEMKQSITDAYGEIIGKLLTLQPVQDDTGEFHSIEVTYSPEAKEIFTAWYNSNAKLRDDINISEHLSSSYAKLEIYVSRLSLILQMLYWASGEDAKYNLISPKAIRGAVALAEYYRTTFGKVYQSITEGETPSLLKQVQELKEKGYSYREIKDITGVPKSTADRWLKSGTRDS